MIKEEKDILKIKNMIKVALVMSVISLLTSILGFILVLNIQDGAQGPQGIQGIQGPQGIQGEPGIPGQIIQCNETDPLFTEWLKEHPEGLQNDFHIFGFN